MPRPRRRPARWLVLADIHANWAALVAVLEHALGHFDAIWFLGDLVGYGPQPVPCVSLFRQLDLRRWCSGNHDLGVLGLLARYDSVSRPSAEALATWQDHRAQLQAEPTLWEWFQTRVGNSRVAPVVRRCGKGKRLVQVFVHACPDEPVGRYLFPSDWGNVLETLRRLENRSVKHGGPAWLVIGHTHMMALMHLGPDDSMPRALPITYGIPISLDRGLHLINPGSVGSPRDGDPRAAYAILDTRRSEVQFHRVEYPVQVVLDDMRRRGPMYPDTLLNVLLTGRSAATRHFDAVYELQDGGLRPRR